MNQNVYLIEMRQLFPSTTHWSRYVRQPSSLRPAVAVQQHYPSPIREAQSLDRTSNSFDACALSPSSGSAVVGRADAETTDYYSEEMRSLGRRGTTSSDTSMSLVRSSPMSNCIRWCQHGHCQQHPLLAESYSDDTNETVAVTTL